MRAEHDDRQVGELAHPLEHVPAVDAGKVDVEDDDVGPAGVQRAQRLLARLGLRDLRAGDLGETADDRPDRLVVVDDQNPCALHAAHTCFLPQLALSSDPCSRCCSRSARLPPKVFRDLPPRKDPCPPSPPLRRPTSPHRRRSGREGPRELTAAFRRYVDAIQVPDGPVAVRRPRGRPRPGPGDHGPCAAAPPSTARSPRRTPARSASWRRSVRQAGRGAVAHPALLARAIVLARTLGPDGRRALDRSPGGPPPARARARRRLASARAGSAADRAHRARRLHEARVVDAVLELLAPHRVADDLLDVVVARARRAAARAGRSR